MTCRLQYKHAHCFIRDRKGQFIYIKIFNENLKEQFTDAIFAILNYDDLSQLYRPSVKIGHVPSPLYSCIYIYTVA